MDANDELTLTAFLFLQDRTEEGLASFDKIDPTQVASRVIYDYLHAVVLFHRGNPEDAKTIASQSLASLPNGIWRDRFQMVIDQAGEIAALQAPAAAASTELEVIAPRLDLTLTDKGKLALRHQSLEKTTLRLFSVDLEMLFSNDPFLLGDSDHSGEPVIRPNTELEVTFEAHRSETIVDLPAGLLQGNLLVSADSGPNRILKILDSREVEILQLPESRTLQVLAAATSRPLPASYVKVYAEMTDGSVVFHKDGYTDLRGKFDYLSHTAVDSTTVKRLAILVSHSEKGARTVIYDR